MTEQSLIDLGTSDDADAIRILNWPGEAVSPLCRGLLALADGARLDAGTAQTLAAHGLVQAGDGQATEPTALGEYLTDLLAHERWQEGDELQALLQGELTGADGREGMAILEVGCSTGRALRSVRMPSVRRFGVDVDAMALALGHRLAEQDKQAISFHCCSAHALPLADGSFDWVICRNALTYMHQRRAISEMARVLKPDGLLFLRVENLRYDLRWVWYAPRLAARCCAMRDLGYGLVHAAVGWQPVPGSRLRGGRAYGSLRRLRRILRQVGCELLHSKGAQRCPVLWGAATQTSLLARKSSPALEPVPVLGWDAVRRGGAFFGAVGTMAPLLM